MNTVEFLNEGHVGPVYLSTVERFVHSPEVKKCNVTSSVSISMVYSKSPVTRVPLYTKLIHYVMLYVSRSLYLII